MSRKIWQQILHTSKCSQMTWFGLITLLINFPSHFSFFLHFFLAFFRNQSLKLTIVNWVEPNQLNLLNILRKFENEDKITKKCSSIHQGHLYTYPDVFETGDIFSSLFEKIRVFQSFSPVHKKTLIRWKDSSVPYGACAVWRMTLPRFVVFFLSRVFFKIRLVPFGS